MKIQYVKSEKKISIVGCGPGLKGYVTQIGIDRIKESETLIGSKRLLEMFPESTAERLNIGRDYHALVDKINSLNSKNIVILVSGDPGFYSLAKIVVKRLGVKNCEVVPGISSVQLAFARIGENWNDAKFLSFHGRDKGLEDLRQIIEDNHKVAILTDEKNNPSELGKLLAENGSINRKVFIFENLSFENEAIYELDIKSLCNVKTKGMNLVIFLKSNF